MSTIQNYTVSNGTEIELRRVSIYTLELATSKFPQPKPPVQIVDGVEQENPAHPSFTDALIAWEREKQNARVDAIYACGIVMPAGESWKAEVAEFRAVAAVLGLDAPTNDWMCYIKHVLLNTADDFLNVQSLIMSGSLPTEEVISAAADDFKSGVEAPADSQGVDTAVGGDGRKS